METVRETQKKYCSRAMVAAIVIALVCILAGQKPLGKGLVLGAVFSVINFIIIGEMLPVNIGRSRKQAAVISMGSIIARYCLLALPLIVAAKFTQFNFFAAAAGIFMVQVVILTEHVVKFLPLIREK